MTAAAFLYLLDARPGNTIAEQRHNIMLNVRIMLKKAIRPLLGPLQPPLYPLSPLLYPSCL